MCRFSRIIPLLVAVLATSVASAQSSAPVLSRTLPGQQLAPPPDAPAITLDLRNYFSVPGLPPGSSLAPYDTLFPTGGGTSVITLTAENSASTVVSTVLSGSTLTLMPLAAGGATISVRAADRNGASATGSFAVTVTSTAPVFTSQPRPQTVAAGSSVVFSAPATGAAAFRWEKNGEAIPDATTSTLVLNNVARADAANYTLFASNALGATASDSARLEVLDAPAADVGRLTNLSILTNAGAGDRVLTVGAVIGPFDASGTLPLVVRAVGPTLAQAPFNVPGTLADPVMTLYSASAPAPLDSNDNWGGGEALRAAFDAVAAFPLPAGSLDSALVRPAPGATVGGYTVQVSGKGAASGQVLAEIYDASGATRSASAPRLINVSTLAPVSANSDLTVGFVIAGQTARTVLVRAVGPSLSRLGVGGVMSDPRLELFNNSNGQRIATNDDWMGALEISNAGTAVGAFALMGGTSQDAALLVTLAPGPYSARVSGVGGAAGTVIVEVYEVP